MNLPELTDAVDRDPQRRAALEAAKRAARLIHEEPDHPRVVAARERVRARREDRESDTDPTSV